MFTEMFAISLQHVYENIFLIKGSGEKNLQFIF